MTSRSGRTGTIRTNLNQGRFKFFSCVTKRQYDINSAAKEAEFRYNTTGVIYAFYHCRFCGTIHLTKRRI